MWGARVAGNWFVGAAAVLALVGSSLIPSSAAFALEPPVLVAPANGAVVAGDPVLRVQVPNQPTAEVRFEGRRKGATVGGPGAGDPFTLVALPDIQNYTSSSRAATIQRQAQWVVDTRAALNTQFVVQLGDLVSSLSWPGHWPYASNGLKVLDDNHVPNAVVAGNHDFDTATGDYAQYDAWFPPSRYADATWTPSTARYGGYMGKDEFGDDPVDRDNMNNYSLFSAGGVDWLVLGLEWEAQGPSLAWADRVLAAYPDREVIMFTHAFLTESGQRRTVAQRPGGTPPETIWQTFVRSHCKIRLVLNGHESGSTQSEARRTDSNDCGTDVHQILSNYQTRPNGGDGWLRAYRFDPEAGTMTATTYSPTLDQYETDANSAFSLLFPLAAPAEAPFVPIATVNAVDGVAETSWGGLQDDVEYEWRAVVSDAAGEVASDPWTFTKEAPAAPFHDGFERTVANGWGTAASGHAWLTSSGSSFAVNGVAGRMAVAPSAQRTATVLGFDMQDAATTMSFSLSAAPTGGGTYVSLLARHTSTADYRAKITFRSSGSAGIALVRRGPGTGETVLASAALPGTFTPGQRVSVRLETEGASPVTLRARSWTTTQEPDGWQVTAVDTSPAAIPSGTVGVLGYVSGTATATPVVAVDRIDSAGLTSVPPPANVAPTASIAITGQSGRHLSVSGAGSTDADGQVQQWSWHFGDGATADGAEATHDYAADGTYTVTLTVTDNEGATGTATTSVVVQTPPPPTPSLAADTFNRSTSGGWGTADLGGVWAATTAPGVQSTANGTGLHTLATPGVSATSALGAPLTADDIEVRIDVSWNRNGGLGTFWAGVSPRSVTASTDYRLKVNVGSANRPRLDLVRRVGNAETVIASAAVTDITVSAGSRYTLVVRAMSEGGVTVLSAKMFPAGTTEPSTWRVTASDSTASLQQPGRVLIWSYLSGSATSAVTSAYDDLSVRTVSG